MGRQILSKSLKEALLADSTQLVQSYSSDDVRFLKGLIRGTEKYAPIGRVDGDMYLAGDQYIIEMAEMSFRE